jgi:Rho-type GTPase-activating protein 1/2
MNCYESLTQKRRKHRNKPRQPTHTLNKALPEPPRQEVPQSSFSSDGLSTPTAESEKSTDPSSKYSSTSRTLTGSSRPDSNLSREMSMGSLNDGKGMQDLHLPRINFNIPIDGLTLPASTYQGSNATTPTLSSQNMSASIYDPVNDLADGLFVPLVLDPTPASGTSPNANALEFPESARDHEKSNSRDYPPRGLSSQSRPSRDYLHEGQDDSRSSSTERRAGLNPHIASLEKSRQSSDHIADVSRKRGPSAATSPRATDASPSPYTSSHNEFRLQDAPKSKKPESRGGDVRSPVTSPSEGNSRNITPQIDSSNPMSPADEKPKEPFATNGSKSQRENTQMSRPKRGDSLGASSSITRKEVSGGALQNIAEFGHERKASSNSARHNSEANGGMTISKPMESPGIAKSIYDTSGATPGSGRGGASVTTPEAFIAPRHAPVPPPQHRPSGSNGTSTSGEREIASPGHAAENGESYEGVLRKMSNAMRGHARSVSDKVIPSPRSQRPPWPRSPLNGSMDLGTPTSPGSREENILLRGQLLRAQQRITELETEKNSLQGIVNGSPEMKQVNTALKEKRSTMAVLDTQREIIARELEAMTEHLHKAKDSNNPLDMSAFESGVLADFTSSMKKLKESLTSEIEGLMQQRSELTHEISNLIQMKDKGFTEYENLSNRNIQLTQHNNELIQSIQELMKANKQPNGLGPNGLGLYIGSGPVSAPSSGPILKEKTEITGSDLKQLMLDSNTSFSHDNEQDAAVITTPHVVKLKQQKPNMLRKGGFGKTLKGIRGALMADRPERAPTYPTEGTPYSQHQDTSGGAVKSSSESKNKFGGFFGSDRNGTKHLRTMQNNSSNPSLVGDLSSSSRKFSFAVVISSRLISVI